MQSYCFFLIYARGEDIFCDKSDLPRKEERASLLGLEAGWCLGSRYYPREQDLRREWLTETAARAEPTSRRTDKSGYREIERAKERPGIDTAKDWKIRRYWTANANPEDRPLCLGRLGRPDRLPFSDCQVKAILQVDAILFLDL